MDLENGVSPLALPSSQPKHTFVTIYENVLISKKKKVQNSSLARRSFGCTVKLTKTSMMQQVERPSNTHYPYVSLGPLPLITRDPCRQVGEPGARNLRSSTPASGYRPTIRVSISTRIRRNSVAQAVESH